MKGEKMGQVIFIITVAIFFVACTTTKPTADEPLLEAVQYMEDTNSSGVIY